ncbi:MAG: DUF340 domain-containing protein [Pyramidobacter sp.]|jgi:hypothetical protein
MERAFVLIKGWLVTGVLASVCNYIYTLRLNKPEKVVTPLEAAPGLLIMLAIIILSQLTHKLMQKAAPKVKAPVVLYITLYGILFTMPGLLPCAGYVYKSIGKISLLPLCTPILAYAGISGGKDLKTFKEQGLAIVLTTLIALFGTFIGSAIIAHFVMKWTGVF